MRISITFILLFLTIVINTVPVKAQPLNTPVPHARAIEVLDGLDIGEVNQILQTRDGLIWLATTNGLVRFDGYNARRFLHNPADSHSISHDHVSDIVEGDNGTLWISTYGGGLNTMDTRLERFSQVDLGQIFSSTQGAALLNQMTLDEQQSLWLASSQGVKRISLADRSEIKLPFALSQLQDQAIEKVFIDSQHQVWLLSKDNGVYRYDNDTLRHFSQNSGLTNSTVWDILETPQGTIWLATYGGLHRFNEDTLYFESKLPSITSGFTAMDLQLRTIGQDHTGQLWLGSNDNGIHMYQPQKDRFIALSGANGRQHFKAERINDVYSDREGTLWLATDDGVILVTKAALDIRYLTNNDSNLVISDVEALDNGKIAFAGNYQYYEYDLKKHDAMAKFNDENRLYRITQTSQGNLLFATLDQGLQLYSKFDNRLYQMPHARPLYSDIPVTGLFDVFVDKQQNTWLLPFPDLPHLIGGIMRFDWQTKQYQTYLPSPFVSDIVELKDNELLLSSDSAGLISLDTQSKLVTDWKTNVPNTPRRIITLFKDSNEQLWLGTRDQGLAKFDEDENLFVFFTDEDGLLSNSIYSIVEDSQNHLWLGSDKGLIRFNPENGEIVNLQESDGLLFSAFYKRAATMAQDGTLLFGTQNGLLALNPEDFALQSMMPEVTISDFKLLNQSVDWRRQDDDQLLSQPIRYTDTLQLSHKHSMFSFEFSANEYIRPEALKFAYMMEGLNSDWFYTDASQRVAHYTTLPKGEYTFRVKVSNRHGQWGDQEARIKISVSPPWWLSWPAYIAYAVILSLSVLLFINIRTKKLVTRAMELERNVAERTAELKQSKDQVTELLAQKQQLFASVSHEFRTPLTLILSPVEQLLTDARGKPISKELGLIKRNGRRLLRMVDQLLEFAKLELKDDSQMEHVSLKQTLDIIVSSFEPLVKTKQIQLHVAAYDDVTLNMLPDSLNKILINILSNAFKYSPPQSDIFVTVERNGQSVAVSIRDTGIGISEADKEAVFQRFNRATQSHGEAVPGAGIGLALVKELVEANFGTITLESELNVGSIFTVTLPTSETGLFAGAQASTALQDVIHEHLDLEIDSVNTADMPAKNGKPIELDDNQKSILIVDDNPDLRDLLNQQLSSKYQCMLAENGQVGLDLARQHLPDLVISDVMMPVMDGYQLTDNLKNDELTSHIPVILLTAKGSTESRLKGLQLLVDDYLAKPFNMEELMLRIHNILTIRDIIKQKFRQVIDQADPQEEMNKLSISDPEQAFVNRVNEQLANFYHDAEFTAKVLSRELGVSERQLQRKLKSQFDLGFPELVRNYRLNKAVEMLSSGQRASQIYHSVGFSSHSYFSSCFKAKFGQTPKEYQSETA